MEGRHARPSPNLPRQPAPIETRDPPGLRLRQPDPGTSRSRRPTGDSALIVLLAALVPALLAACTSTGPVAGERIDRSLNEEIVHIAGPGERTLVATWYKPNGDGPFPVIVFSHGSPAEGKDRPAMGRYRQLAPIAQMVKRGFAVLVPMRRGFGETGGTFEESFGTCANPDFYRAGMAAARDILAAVHHAQAQTFVRRDQVLLVGQSAGGFSSIAAASLAPGGVVGVLSFAGGSGGDPVGHPGDPCHPERMAQTFARWGQTIRVPVLWHYAENDHFFAPRHVRDWYAAFTAAGGTGRLVIQPPFGRDGHALFVSRDAVPIWTPEFDRFVAGLHLSSAPPPRADWPGLTAAELAETFDPSTLYPGVRMTRDECARKKFAVWVEHRYGTECIRYFPSPDIEHAPRAVFFFHGDVLDGKKPLPGATVNNSVAAKLKEAQHAAFASHVPFVLVSRPGAFGSSGEHDSRRRPKEFWSLNAAVDAIKARHGIGEVVLAGQSGGATTVGALLTLGRTDVPCAVAASGGYDVIGRGNWVWETRHLGRRGCDTTLHCDPYNVIDFTAGVRRDPDRRVFIIGDPRDVTTPFMFQKAFAQKLQQAGHDVTVIEARGLGPNHHGLAPVALETAAWCSAGVPTDEIVRRIESGI